VILGKSVLCAHLIDIFRAEKNCGFIYYFCNSNADGRELCTKVLKSLALQILRANKELASHVADRYASQGLTASLFQVRRLLPELIGAISTTRIIIDGLDECSTANQKSILQELSHLMKWSADRCKLLFSSRDNATMARALIKKPTIFLSEIDKRANIDTDIRLYVHEELAVLRDRFEDAVIDDVEKAVVMKANGKSIFVTALTSSFEVLNNRYVSLCETSNRGTARAILVARLAEGSNRPS
jgi:Zn-dependent M16 (insulinase) family peptidase